MNCVMADVNNVAHEKPSWSTECVVEGGVIYPTLKGPKDYDYTSGHLKYLFWLEGKRVKITIEVVE